MFKWGRRPRVKPAIVDLLERLLKLEYSLVVNYPRLARLIKDGPVRDSTAALGKASLKHAHALAGALSEMGGSPTSSTEPLEDESDLVAVFTQQLAREHQARQMHLEGEKIAPGEELKSEFRAMAEDEREHIETVEQILAYLKKGRPDRRASLISVR